MTTSPQTDAPWLDNYPAGVDFNAEIDLTPVTHRVAAACEKYGDRPALDFMGAETSYADLAADIDAFCGALQTDFGIKKGDRVALLLPNTPFYVVAYYAVLKAGAIVVNCNPLYTVNELNHILADAGAKLLVTLDLKALFEKAEALHAAKVASNIIVCRFTEALPGLKKFLFGLLKRADIADTANSPVAASLTDYRSLIDKRLKPTPVSIDPKTDVAVQQYTGGTTGLPKGAMLSHANIAANLSQIDVYGIGVFNHPAKTVAVLPFFHIFAMTVCLNTPLANGGQVIMLPRFEIKALLSLIARTKPTILPSVPTLIRAIATSELTAKFDISSVKLCISGGAPLPDDTRDMFAKISNALLAEGYGLTECSPVVCCAALKSESRRTSIGMPLPGTHVRFCDPDNPGTQMPAGEPGEIQIRGPQVMLGYYNNEKATADAFVDGWFRTGDVGRTDKDGYIYIVDRIKDLIICSGNNVYPSAIETVLYTHPAIDEASVIGVPDEKRGEIPVAFVKL
ncbi:MAG: long-chain fatty acid--CoA ligase, partial [Alphaproteobacteria bacterium]|nr:long-chain fatty acid--CoA ligase [Alphaproteobacteria bacterium]